MKKQEIKSKIDAILLKIEFLRNNTSMAAETLYTIRSRESKTIEDSNLKLYEFERIGVPLEITFNYIDSELRFLFDELTECFALLEMEETA